MSEDDTSNRGKVHTARLTHFTWQVELIGEYLRLFCPMKQPQKRVPGKRGKILDFSPGARLRMMKACCQTDWTRTIRNTYYTITTPDQCRDTDKDGREKHLTSLWRKVEEYCGGFTACLWRLEWKPRKTGIAKGEPVHHWHFVIFSCPWLPVKELGRFFGRVIGYGKSPSTKMEELHGGSETMSYVSKYSAKAPHCSLDYATYSNRVNGKCWGWRRPEMIPKCDPEFYALCENEAIRQLQSESQDYVKPEGRHPLNSFCVLGKRAKIANHRILTNTLDKESRVSVQ